MRRTGKGGIAGVSLASLPPHNGLLLEPHSVMHGAHAVARNEEEREGDEYIRGPLSGSPSDTEVDDFQRKIDEFVLAIGSERKSDFQRKVDELSRDIAMDHKGQFTYSWMGQDLTTPEYTAFRRVVKPEDMMTHLAPFSTAEDGRSDLAAWRIRAELLLPLIKMTPAYPVALRLLKSIPSAKGCAADAIIMNFMLAMWKSETATLSNSWVSSTLAIGFGQILQSNFTRVMSQPAVKQEYGCTINHNKSFMWRTASNRQLRDMREVPIRTPFVKKDGTRGYYTLSKYLANGIWGDDPRAVFEYLNWNVVYAAESLKALRSQGYAPMTSAATQGFDPGARVIAAMRWFYHNGWSLSPVNAEVRTVYPAHVKSIGDAMSKSKLNKPSYLA